MAVNAPQATRSNEILKFLTKAWSWLFLILVLLFFELWSRFDGNTRVNTFIFNIASVQSVLLYATQYLMMALGLTIVIISAGIDLSVGFTSGLASVTAAVIIKNLTGTLPDYLSFGLAVIGGILMAMLFGYFNGLMVAKLKVPSFIGTLGTSGVARGVAFLIAGGSTVAIKNTVAREFGNGDLLGLPIPVVIAAMLTLVFHYLLSSTKFGLYVYAMGGNFNSAVRAGVNTTRLTISLYVLSAFTAAIFGLFYMGRFSGGKPDAGDPVLLNAVAAVFIGGASLTGGSGTVMGTVIGALILAIIQFGLVFIQLPPFWQFIAVGLVIILAVLIDQFRDRLIRGGGSGEGR
ncbi:MAG: ABC transporter permease [Trueperaceae bacterium]|nr:ABC transporter permease [Trueperaceae bacterium]